MIFGDSISVASNLLDSQHLKHDTISHIYLRDYTRFAPPHGNWPMRAENAYASASRSAPRGYGDGKGMVSTICQHA